MKRRIFILVVLIASLMVSFSLFAEEGSEAKVFSNKESVRIFTAGFAMALASAVCGIAQGMGISAACKGASRNPAIAGKFQTMMIIGLVFIESLVLYTLLIVIVKV